MAALLLLTQCPQPGRRSPSHRSMTLSCCPAEQQNHHQQQPAQQQDECCWRHPLHLGHGHRHLLTAPCRRGVGQPGASLGHPSPQVDHCRVVGAPKQRWSGCTLGSDLRRVPVHCVSSPEAVAPACPMRVELCLGLHTGSYKEEGPPGPKDWLHSPFTLTWSTLYPAHIRCCRAAAHQPSVMSSGQHLMCRMPDGQQPSCSPSCACDRASAPLHTRYRGMNYNRFCLSIALRGAGRGTGTNCSRWLRSSLYKARAAC